MEESKRVKLLEEALQILISIISSECVSFKDDAAARKVFKKLKLEVD